MSSNAMIPYLRTPPSQLFPAADPFNSQIPSLVDRGLVQSISQYLRNAYDRIYALIPYLRTPPSQLFPAADPFNSEIPSLVNRDFVRSIPQYLRNIYGRIYAWLYPSRLLIEELPVDLQSIPFSYLERQDMESASQVTELRAIVLNAAYVNELHALNTYILSLSSREALFDEHENRLSEIVPTFRLRGAGVQDLGALYNLISEINNELFIIDRAYRNQRTIWNSFFTRQYRDRDRAFEFSRQFGINAEILTESVAECIDYDMQRAIEIAGRIHPVLYPIHRGRAYADITLALLQRPNQIERAIQFTNLIPSSRADIVDRVRAYRALALALAQTPNQIELAIRYASYIPDGEASSDERGEVYSAIALTLARIGQIDRAIQFAYRIPETSIQARIRSYNVIANILIDQNQVSRAFIMACSIPPEDRTDDLKSTIARADRLLKGPR